MRTKMLIGAAGLAALMGVLIPMTLMRSAGEP